MVVSSVIIGRMLGPEDYGIYSLVISVPSLFIGLIGLGINSALTKFTTDFRIKSRTSDFHYIIKTGLLIKATLGIGAAVFCIIFSDFLATNLINTPGAGFYIQVASVLVIFQALFETLNSIFIGLDEMQNNAFSSAIRAVSKVLLSPVLIFLGFSIVGAVAGHVSAYVIGVAFGLALLTIKLHKTPTEGETSSGILKTMFKFSIPLYVSGLISLLSTEYQTIILAFFVSKTAIGNFQVTALFNTVVSVIAHPFVALFPAFSKFDPGSKQMSQFFRRSVKYTSFLIVPAAMAIAVMSQDLVYTFYSAEYSLAPNYIVFQMVVNLVVGFGSIVLPYVFNGTGRSDIMLKSSLINLFVFLPLAPLLISVADVIGLIFALFAGIVAALLYRLYMAKKIYELRLDLQSSSKIYATSMISAIILYLFTLVSPFTGFVNLILAAIFFMFVYATLVPIFGVVNNTDLEIFAGMVKNIKNLSPILKLLLSYETKILNLKEKTKNKIE